MSRRSVHAIHSRSSFAGLPALALAVVLAWSAGPARAFEAFDGRLQAHGFFESQMRAISADYSEDWDMTQWYQVFNLELEIDILPEPLGPIDLLQGYVRAEVRYDCVYTRGCGMFKGVNAFGDRSKSLPRRLSNARLRTAMGAIDRNQSADGDDQDYDRRSGGTTDPVPLNLVSGFSTLAGSAGVDQTVGDPTGRAPCLNDFVTSPTQQTRKAACASLVGGEWGIKVVGSDGVQAANDDPFRYVFQRYEDYRFTQIQGRGGATFGTPTRVLGPWLPKNFVEPNAGLADRINPFDRDERSPVLTASVFNQEFDERFTNKLTTKGFDPTNAFGPNGWEIAREQAQKGARRAADKTSGTGANPYRPIPVKAPGRAAQGDDVPRGMYLPTEGLRNVVDDLDNPQFNFRQAEREWNRGASQQDEKELKEAYLDMELFDSRLWLRIGKQSIVWGKTELFRTTDQFNPQDLALASLPSLEESRIALWAFRAVWSFYEVGPFSDVRLEGAFNFDDFEPADLGACGEAYTPDLVCELTFGMFAHGTAGLGIAGVDRPDDPWGDLDGWEVGGRLEWRWDRFSFALTDFWGYADTPTVTRIQTFERNVDPNTGRPRRNAARGPCTISPDDAQGREQQYDCLKPGPTFRTPLVVPLADTTEVYDTKDRVNDDGNALLYHHVNQQVFAMICSTTIGFSSLDRASCAQTVFGSTRDGSPPLNLRIAQVISAVVAGSPGANNIIAALLTNGVPLPLVQLSKDPNDLSNGGTNCKASFFAFGTKVPFIPGPNPSSGERPNCGGDDPSTLRQGVHGNFAVAGEALAQVLTPEQEALLGCGPFWGTNCDDDGLDLMNTELSALIQSFSGVQGTKRGWRADGQMGFKRFGDYARDVNGAVRQPGTVGFVGSVPCTVGDLRSPGQKAGGKKRLPGCRSPYTNSNWDINVDGDPRTTQVIVNQAVVGVPLFTAPGTHPFTGQSWENEMAAASWNFQMLLIGNSPELSDDLTRIAGRTDLTPPQRQQRLIKRSYSSANGKCSFLQAQFCSTPEAIFAVSGVTRAVVEAGGNGRYGRQTFTWHSGGEAILTYEKRNVLGFSLDFAEDVSKSNWSFEFTWIGNQSYTDSNQNDGLSTVDTLNFTVSVDRPTFINFLNANRTFFFNSQWFFQYIGGYRSSFTSNGPYNVLGTFSVSTGYYQDRLLPSVTFVYDVQSVSGAVLPQVTYRYDEAFSISVGAAVFMGGTQLKESSVNPLGGVSNMTGAHQDKIGVQNGLSPIHDRDEVFVRLRYTF